MTPSTAAVSAPPPLSTALDAIDPFDVFVLDALLADCHNESQEHDQSHAAQTALASFLADVDTFNHDLRAASDCPGGFDLTAAVATAQVALPACTLDSLISNSNNSNSIDSASPSDSSAVPSDSSSSTGLTSTERLAAVAHVPSHTAAACPPLSTLAHPASLTRGSSNTIDAPADPSHDVLVQTAFSLFAQNRALAFALEPAPPLKRKRRIRPKEELDTLRDTAASLERDLATLQAGPTTAGLSNQSPTLGNSSTVDDSAPLERNRKLRRTLNTQLALSTALSDELRKTQSDQPEIARWLAAEKLGQHLTLTPADYTVFREAITGKLDAIYARLDDVFAASSSRSLANAQVTAQSAHVAIGPDNRATLHFRDEKTVPFGFQSVADACWRMAKQDAIRASDDIGIAEMLRTTDDVLLVKKALPLDFDDSESVAVPVRAVSKRFLSHDRMAFCWEGTAEWPRELVERHGGSRNTSVPMREKGWGLVRPIGSGLCNLQICLHVVPGLSDERLLDDNGPSRVQELSELVLPTYQQMMASRFQMIENLLLDAHR